MLLGHITFHLGDEFPRGRQHRTLWDWMRRGWYVVFGQCWSSWS
jgi:hypothetical protein